MPAVVPQPGSIARDKHIQPTNEADLAADLAGILRSRPRPVGQITDLRQRQVGPQAFGVATKFDAADRASIVVAIDSGMHRRRADRNVLAGSERILPCGGARSDLRVELELRPVVAVVEARVRVGIGIARRVVGVAGAGELLQPVDRRVEELPRRIGCAAIRVADAVARVIVWIVGEIIEPCRHHISAEHEHPVSGVAVQLLVRRIDQRLCVGDADEDGVFVRIGNAILVIVADQQANRCIERLGVVDAILRDRVDEAIVVAVHRIGDAVAVAVDRIEQFANGKAWSARLLGLIVGDTVPEGAPLWVCPESRRTDADAILLKDIVVGVVDPKRSCC